MIVKRANGDILAAPESYIAQQTNCLTLRAHGLSASIARRFPWADAYGKRARGHRPNCTMGPSSPGTVEVYHSEDGTKHVACLMAQWAPGKPLDYEARYPPAPAGLRDTEDQRRAWFARCLASLQAHLREVSFSSRGGADDGGGGATDSESSSAIDTVVAVPDHIGCGLAGGDWAEYERMLEESAVPFAVYSLPAAVKPPAAMAARFHRAG